ncbi:MAG: excinuclease ABC subunit UvrC, partial [Ignavibacteriota bacterium]
FSVTTSSLRAVLRVLFESLIGSSNKSLESKHMSSLEDNEEEIEFDAPENRGVDFDLSPEDEEDDFALDDEEEDEDSDLTKEDLDALALRAGAKTNIGVKVPVNDDEEDRDIFAIAFEGKDSTCAVFNIRSGKLIGKKQLKLAIEEGEELSNIYSAAIKFYYGDQVEIPREVIVEITPEDTDALTEWLRMKSNRKTKIFVPQRGDLKSLVKMCKENAILQLKEIQLQKMKNLGNVSYSVSALQRDLRLKTLPRKIECFDISNLQGTDSVASMVVFEDGKPKKSLYRKFIIKTVEGPDDFSSMREVIERRYTRLKEENQPLPDLIMVDGGKGQLSSAVEILDNLGFNNYNIIGLAKRLEEVFLPNNSDPELIPKTSSGLKLLQQIRDEAHRFAITFHRVRRSKRIIRSELTDIKGIGTETAKLLLEKFGSLESIKQASQKELEEVVGIKKTDILLKYFNQ